MGIIMLFWYLFYVEQMLRNGNSTNVDVIEDTNEND